MVPLGRSGSVVGEADFGRRGPARGWRGYLSNRHLSRTFPTSRGLRNEGRCAEEKGGLSKSEALSFKRPGKHSTILYLGTYARCAWAGGTLCEFPIIIFYSVTFTPEFSIHMDS